MAELHDDGQQVMLTLRLPPHLTLGSERRAKQMTSRTVALMKRARPLAMEVEGDCVAGTYSTAHVDAVRSVCRKINAYLASLELAPLHPKIVDEVLRITSSERTRWTKDGRLPRTGAGSFGLGRRMIFFPLYPIDIIRRLASEPETIEGWRLSDRRQEQP